MDKQIQAAATGSTQYLTFMLGGEAFAIGILVVREIIEYQSLTTVPMMPEFVRGVINLRGAVVPVLDLKASFGRTPSAATKRTCIVVVEVQSERERQVIGLIVDAVNEVIDIDASDVEPPPPFGAGMRRELIHGMGKVKGRFVILLDAGRVLSHAEIDSLAQAPAELAEAA